MMRATKQIKYDNRNNHFRRCEGFCQILDKRPSSQLSPDDDFSFYVNYETKEPTFSPEEAAKYNDLMNECFDVCEKANVDVYDIMGEYLQKTVIA